MAVEFKSPTNRVRLCIDGTYPLGGLDTEWLKLLAGKPGLINDRLREEREKGQEERTDG